MNRCLPPSWHRCKQPVFAQHYNRREEALNEKLMREWCWLHYESDARHLVNWPFITSGAGRGVGGEGGAVWALIRRWLAFSLLSWNPHVTISAAADLNRPCPAPGRVCIYVMATRPDWNCATVPTSHCLCACATMYVPVFRLSWEISLFSLGLATAQLNTFMAL